MKTQRCCAADPLIRVELEEELRKQLEETPDEESLKKNSKILYALSHPLRLKIAFLLLKSDHCVCELVRQTKKKQNLVSHHLTILRKNGVLDSYMKSRWKYYKINEGAVCILKGINNTGIKPDQNEQNRK
ncbi:MAG: metalloregulator ArsR/SmtB family transcription factor [Candidatus Methanoperedens sp.]|nr:metalloregulator ArsR/SmtB family transcription factor [Candidatus Methanoperedens sp.]MCZ7359003.1 metalloregulator ArsR/SmtB family transcription factor [Candidatus Methanoperedens sp.]HLB71833.1 metalloregulator ArsR/SmtB family transcription factor [Candidatus Methanoperedens sp.]